ncbi:glycosyltransferase, partial [Paraglaciecola sp.]|uniref:glycosyltransferase n=1 Tax=Paraglaciecola sp. TaxID=1920173 RepID=UPI003EF82537
CFGGGERVALTYQYTLNSLGVANCIFALNGGRNSDLENVYIFNGYWRYCFSVLKQIFEQAKEPYCVIAHTNRALIICVLLKLFFRKKVRIFYVQHLFYSPQKMRLLSFCQGVLEKIIQITPITTKLLEQNFKEDKRFYLNNYLALDSYSKGNSSLAVEELKELAGDRKVITFLGRVTKDKNAEHLLRLLKLLPKDSYFGLVLGTGDELGYIKALALELKLDNLFIAGFQEYPLAFLAASDYMFFCSSYAGEMMPMAVLEAKSLGCKVIGYTNELNRHIIPASNLFDFADFEAIANGIVTSSIIFEPNEFDEEYGRARLSLMLG